MNLLEVVEEITKDPKYYAGKCEQAYASMTVRSIRAGLAKPKTIEKFLAMFGYAKTVTIEQWEKSDKVKAA